MGKRGGNGVDTSREILLERVNQATGGYPFLEWNARNLSYIPHLHEEMEVIYAAQGPVTVTAGLCTQQLEEGELYVFMPFEIHDVATQPGSVAYILKLPPHRELPEVDFAAVRLGQSRFSPGDPQYGPLKEQVLSIRREDLEREEGYALAVLRYAAGLELILLPGTVPTAGFPSPSRTAKPRMWNFCSGWSGWQRAATGSVTLWTRPPGPVACPATTLPTP